MLPNAEVRNSGGFTHRRGFNHDCKHKIDCKDNTIMKRSSFSEALSTLSEKNLTEADCGGEWNTPIVEQSVF